RLRPRLDAERAEWLELRARRLAPKQLALAERTHDDHRHPELGRERQQLALALVRVVRELDRLEAARPHRLGELAEGSCVPVSDADAADPTGGPLILEPRQVLAPGDEIVDLLDLDAAEPAELSAELLTALGCGRRPDLRGDVGSVAAALERGGERGLRAVHGRRVDHATAGLQRCADDLAGEARVVAEGARRAEADDGAEATILHQEASLPAARPAANAAAKKAGSSAGPRPMYESGRAAQASSQPTAPRSSATVASPRQSRRTARA